MIITSYLTAFLPVLKPLANPNQFFTLGRRYEVFPPYMIDLDLAEADQHCIWGRENELVALLKEKKNPALLTTWVNGEDHRGPGFIPKETIYVRAVCLKDFRMADRIKPYLIERCGLDEFREQFLRAKSMLVADKENKQLSDAADLNALKKLLSVIDKAMGITLASNKELHEARLAFQEQLQKPGSLKILEEIVSAYEKVDIRYAGSLINYAKVAFIVNKIFGLAQKKRCSVYQLQWLFSYSNYTNSFKRPNILLELGILGNVEGVKSVLGDDCHLALGKIAKMRLLFVAADWRMSFEDVLDRAYHKWVSSSQKTIDDDEIKRSAEDEVVAFRL